jgi:hypothetical protein
MPPVSLVLLLLITVGDLQHPVGPAAARDVEGPLWLAMANEPQPRMSPRLAQLIDRIGPNMRASADYHDFRDVKLNESLEAWQLLHEQTMEFAGQKAQSYKPKLIRLLSEANVSSACMDSARATVDAMGKLESWAIQSEYMLTR